jgi:hypothetical protein
VSSFATPRDAQAHCPMNAVARLDDAPVYAVDARDELSR